MNSLINLIRLLVFGFLFLHIPLQSKNKPNVLFLAVDDMNDWIGCLGKTPRAITPNIDKLAKSGVNFTNAHTAGVFCAPSRAAIFSGQFASTNLLPSWLSFTQFCIFWLNSSRTSRMFSKPSGAFFVRSVVIFGILVKNLCY